MKKKFIKELCGMSIAGTVLLCGCNQTTPQVSEVDNTSKESSVITDYNWQGAQDGSLIVCEADETFKYYRSADDLTNNYYSGSYEFYMGEDAVTYITTTLSDYGVTKEELEGIFANSEEYEESNFVCFILNNEACIVDGENQIESPYQTPYFGFCLEEEGTPYLDIANMNTGNSFIYIAK